MEIINSSKYNDSDNNYNIDYIKNSIDTKDIDLIVNELSDNLLINSFKNIESFINEISNFDIFALFLNKDNINTISNNSLYIETKVIYLKNIIQFVNNYNKTINYIKETDCKNLDINYSNKKITKSLYLTDKLNSNLANKIMTNKIYFKIIYYITTNIILETRLIEKTKSKIDTFLNSIQIIFKFINNYVKRSTKTIYSNINAIYQKNIYNLEKYLIISLYNINVLYRHKNTLFKSAVNNNNNFITTNNINFEINFKYLTVNILFEFYFELIIIIDYLQLKNNFIFEYTCFLFKSILEDSTTDNTKLQNDIKYNLKIKLNNLEYKDILNYLIYLNNYLECSDKFSNKITYSNKFYDLANEFDNNIEAISICCSKNNNFINNTEIIVYNSLKSCISEYFKEAIIKILENYNIQRIIDKKYYNMYYNVSKELNINNIFTKLIFNIEEYFFNNANLTYLGNKFLSLKKHYFNTVTEIINIYDLDHQIYINYIINNYVFSKNLDYYILSIKDINKFEYCLIVNFLIDIIEKEFYYDNIVNIELHNTEKNILDFKTCSEKLLYLLNKSYNQISINSSKPYILQTATNNIDYVLKSNYKINTFNLLCSIITIPSHCIKNSLINIPNIQFYPNEIINSFNFIINKQMHKTVLKNNKLSNKKTRDYFIYPYISNINLNINFKNNELFIKNIKLDLIQFSILNLLFKIKEKSQGLYIEELSNNKIININKDVIEYSLFKLINNKLITVEYIKNKTMIKLNKLIVNLSLKNKETESFIEFISNKDYRVDYFTNSYYSIKSDFHNLNITSFDSINNYSNSINKSNKNTDSIAFYKEEDSNNSKEFINKKHLLLEMYIYNFIKYFKKVDLNNILTEFEDYVKNKINLNDIIINYYFKKENKDLFKKDFKLKLDSLKSKYLVLQDNNFICYN